MATPINLRQPSKNIILDLLNRDNNRTETLSTVSFGPVSVTPPGSLRNTTAMLTAIGDSGRVGSVAIFWNRLDIDVLLADVPKIVVLTQTPQTTYDLLDAFNLLFELNLEQEDVILEPVSGLTHVLKMAPGSYAWIGEVNLTILLPPSGIDLGTDITITDLDGFSA